MKYNWMPIMGKMEEKKDALIFKGGKTKYEEDRGEREGAEVGLFIDQKAIPIPPEALAICRQLNIDPLEAIASGALLLTVKPEAAERVCQAIEANGVNVSDIGWVTEGHEVAMRTKAGIKPLVWPPRDALAPLFEKTQPTS